MRARGYLAEQHLIPADEQFDTVNAVAVQSVHNFLGNILCLDQKGFRHLLGLPAFLVVAVFLAVSNGRTEMEAVNGVVRDLLRTKPYSAELRVIAVDAGYQAPSVYSACAALAREFRGRRIIPARGLAGDRYSEPSKSISIRCGVLADYRKSRTGNALMMWDSHHWHIVEQRGFLLPVAAEGAVGVFGGDASAHAVFADQVAADKLKRSFVNPYGRTVAIWETNGRNEMGDVVAEALAAISCEGGIAPGMPSSIGQNAEAKEAAELVEAEAKRPKRPTIGNMPLGVPGRARGWVVRW